MNNGPFWGVSLLLCTVVLLLARPEPAPGHAIVVESSPASGEVLSRAPFEITLRFNSRIEKTLSKATLTGPGGDPLPLPQSAPDAAPDRLIVSLPPLQPGLYLLRWKVLSADGHVTQGAFRFAVAP